MSEPTATPTPTDADLAVEVHLLSGRIDALRLDVQAKTAQTRRRTNVLAGFLFAVAVIGGALAIFTVQATSKNAEISADNAAAIAENNLRWCPVVLPIAPKPGDPKPAGTPEQVERAQRIRAAFTQLVVDFGCR